MLNGIPNVDCLHAGMSRKEREEAVSRMRRGESWIMVSTEVMARGMDFKGVREVINYDFPQSVQSYVHRIGMLLSVVIYSCSFFEQFIGRSYGACWKGRQGCHLLYQRGCSVPEDVSYPVRYSVCSSLTLGLLAVLQMYCRARMRSPLGRDDEIR